MDAGLSLPDGALSSPAVARNTAPILERLETHLPQRARVLEIASGGGEHALAFARALPEVHWQTSDPSPGARASINAWRTSANLPNLPVPLALDVLDQETWPAQAYDVVVCINMIHISPWSATEALMAGASRVLAARNAPGGLLFLYGPFRESDRPLAPSNAAFDESLKARDPRWGLRDRDTVLAAAKAERLQFTLRTEMPANNLSLLFRWV